MPVPDTAEYLPPCSDLFIYYLEGTLRNDPEHLDHFIGNWQEDGYTFLFFSAPSLDQVLRLIRGFSPLRLIDHYQMPYLDWVGDKIVPFETDCFRISPPWDRSCPQTSKLPISLDPGVVFGTGTHPTTRDCIEALELAFQLRPMHTAHDLGTGTGILAVAAARLGCPLTLAVDLNRLAVRTALANIRANQLTASVLAVQGSAVDFIQLPADLLIANIHYDVMKRLIASGGFMNKNTFILSGLLRSEAAEVEHQLSRLPVRILNKWVADGIWHTYWGMKQ